MRPLSGTALIISINLNFFNLICIRFYFLFSSAFLGGSERVNKKSYWWRIVTEESKMSKRDLWIWTAENPRKKTLNVIEKKYYFFWRCEIAPLIVSVLFFPFFKFNRLVSRKVVLYRERERERSGREKQREREIRSHQVIIIKMYYSIITIIIILKQVIIVEQ